MEKILKNCMSPQLSNFNCDQINEESRFQFSLETFIPYIGNKTDKLFKLSNDTIECVKNNKIYTDIMPFSTITTFYQISPKSVIVIFYTFIRSKMAQ